MSTQWRASDQSPSQHETSNKSSWSRQLLNDVKLFGENYQMGPLAKRDKWGVLLKLLYAAFIFHLK